MLYPDSDEIRLQLGAVMSYLVNDEKIKGLEEAEADKKFTGELEKLKKQRTSAEETINMIINTHEDGNTIIEASRFSESETELKNGSIRIPITIKNEIINKVLDILIKASKIVFHEGKVIREGKKLSDEYWVKTSVKDVEIFLKNKKLLEKLILRIFQLL